MSARKTTGLPRLVPRSAVVERSASPSRSQSPSTSPGNLSSDSEHDEDAHKDGLNRVKAPHRKPSERGSGGVNGNRMSMLDFLAAEPPADFSIPPLPNLPASTRLATTSTSSSSNKPNGSLARAVSSPPNTANRNVGAKRKSLTLVAREPTRTNSSLLSPSPASAIPIFESSRETDLPAAPLSAGPEMPARRREMTAWEFLSADPEEDLGHKGKAKVQEENDSRSIMPLIQLKVIPVTDSLIMFGSTQTSSNYSLSGKVVVQANKRQSNGMPGPSARRGDPTMRSGVFDAAATVSDGASSPHAVESEGRRELDDIQLQSLHVVFSGYALYVDHTGRFSALKLANVRQELLQQGTTIPLPTKRGQEYEIDFNLSVPGWLPASISTRFGGTFYCIESFAEYHYPQGAPGQKSNASLIPPRNDSRGIPPLPLANSMDESSYESDVAAVPSKRVASKDEPLMNLLSAPLKTTQDGISLSSSPSGAHSRNSWLTKTAKQLQIKVSKTGSSPGPASPSGVAQPASLASTEDRPTQASRRTLSQSDTANDHGNVRVQSKAKVIVIRRCREVVPVPVARMAIIGPEGLPEGALQDPPPAPRSSSVDSSTTRLRSSTITPAIRRTQSPPPLVPSALDAPSDPAKLGALASLSSSQPPTPRRASSAAPTTEAPPRRPSQSHASSTSSSSAVPMRHFLHRPMLHPPADAQISHADGGLPFSLTLTLPSHVSVDGPGSDVLSFGVQIEVGRSTAWSKVREQGGLRLRDMELSCTQTERHR